MPDSADSPSRQSGLLPLSVRGLVYRAGDRRLIDDMSFDLDHAGITVIMGPNGAGKSLLLRLLHGLIQAHDGEIRFAGVPLNDTTRAQQAMVFQRPVMLRRSVAANLDFALSLNKRHHRNSRAERRDALLNEVGLDKKYSQPARLLSGGEQQRLSLARALAGDPELLFLDEPTANLDPASTAQIERIVRDRVERGTVSIFVSHDIGQARRIADNILFLHAGKLIEQAPATQFLNAPGTAEAEDFIAGRLLV